MKYYAVKIGRVPGIYTSWDECQKQTKGFSCPIFRSFQNLEDAMIFMEDIKETKIRYDYIIYTDGSYSNKKSGGSALCLETQTVFYGRNVGKQSNNMGELYGIFLAISHFGKMNESILIKIDSEYAHHVITGEYKAKENIKEISLIQAKIKNRKIHVTFEHVYGHSNNKGNELADFYAKKALLSDSVLVKEILD